MANEIKNPFEGYAIKATDNGKYTLNPVLEIVNCYYKMNGWEKMPKEFYKGRYSYGKLAKEAKMLHQVLKNNLDDCIWALDRMKYLAEKGKFDWSIITCLKHKKL